MTPSVRTMALMLVASCSSFDAASTPSAADAGDEASTTSDGGGPPGDGGPDTALPDGGETRGCTGHPADPAHFCDDFDTGGDVAFRWQKSVGDGGVIGETDAAYSAPRAFVASFPNGVGVNTPSMLVKKKDASLTFDGKKKITISFRLKVPVTPFPTGVNGYMHVALVTFDPVTACTASTQRSIEINLDSKTAAMNVALKGLVTGQCSDAGNADFDFFPAPFGAAYYKDVFRRVVLEILREPCPSTAGLASVKITVDGVQSECRSLGVDPFTKAGRLDLNAGIFAGQATGPTTAIYDDIVLDVD